MQYSSYYRFPAVLTLFGFALLFCFSPFKTRKRKKREKDNEFFYPNSFKKLFYYYECCKVIYNVQLYPLLPNLVKLPFFYSILIHSFLLETSGVYLVVYNLKQHTVSFSRCFPGLI